MKQYINCGGCEGVGCAACDWAGRWINPAHERAMRLHLKALLDSEPFLAELENGNYHGAIEFLQELRDHPW